MKETKHGRKTFCHQSWLLGLAHAALRLSRVQSITTEEHLVILRARKKHCRNELLGNMVSPSAEQIRTPGIWRVHGVTPAALLEGVTVAERILSQLQELPQRKLAMKTKTMPVTQER